MKQFGPVCFLPHSPSIIRLWNVFRLWLSWAQNNIKSVSQAIAKIVHTRISWVFNFLLDFWVRVVWVGIIWVVWLSIASRSAATVWSTATVISASAGIAWLPWDTNGALAARLGWWRRGWSAWIATLKWKLKV